MAKSAKWVRWARGHLLGPTSRKGMVALADQSLVSGTSFLSTVLIGRACGAEELGAYSLGFTLIVLAQSALNSLVLIPYTVHVNRTGGRRHRLYAGMTLAQTGVLAAVSMTATLLWGTVLASGITQSGVSTVVWSLAAVLPFVMLRELARRFGFAHFNTLRTLMLDATVATIQVGGLVFLSVTGWLSASLAFAVMGISCAVAGGTWLFLRRADFRIAKKAWMTGVGKNWRFGRWVFASQLVGQLNSDILILWLLVFMIGKAASGVFAACTSIVLFSNPFILGISYIVTPRIARAYSEGGARELRRVVAKTALVVGGVMALFALVVVVAGGAALRLLFGAEYAGDGMTVSVLAIGTLVRSIGMGVRNGLWAINRPSANFQANVVGLVVTLIAVACLVPVFHLTGTALGLVCGYCAELAIRYYHFYRLTATRPGGMP